jgi:hypothetical protein
MSVEKTSKPVPRVHRRRTPRPNQADLWGLNRVHVGLPGRWRLGYGELADPRLVRDVARIWFFEAIDDVVARVYEYLKEVVFPPYQAFFQTVTGDSEPDGPGDERHLERVVGVFIAFCARLSGAQPTGTPLSWYKLVPNEHVSPALPPLRANLEWWGKEFFLSDPWCLDTGLATLLQIQVNELMRLPTAEQHTGFAYPSSILPATPDGYLLATSPPGEPAAGTSSRSAIQPIDAPYSPYYETRAEAKMRLLPSKGEETDDYLDLVEAGCVGAVKVRQESERHFQWLALYQCLKISLTDIATQLPADLSTVSVPVNKLARLTELSLRPHPDGRPTGADDRGPRSSRR